jgi:cytidylate kinase
MIITIDGPAGSGKSSTAREVARRLGYRHLDSGAFYRALTWAALDARIDPDAWPSLTAEQLDAFGIRAEADEHSYALCAGERDVSSEIRSGDVTAHVSRMAALPRVRDWLLDRLRNAAAAGDLVTDGRDMGTVVFPDAELKVFLIAHPETRAERRLREQGHEPLREHIVAEAERLATRDRADSERETAPLRKPDDAVEIDTSELDFEEQVAQIVALARERSAPGQ